MTKGRIKYVLATLGAIYLVVFTGYLIHAALNRENTVEGPSELELHPEKAAEIRAKERAGEMQKRLKLTDEQTKQAAEILQKHAPMGGPGGPPMGDPREGFQAMRDELSKILTPEQQALQAQMGPPGGPGGPRGPGGPGGPGGRGPGGPPGMNSERMDALKSVMTPEQKERFEKQMERMKNRRPPGGPGGGRGGPGGGPDGGPPGGPPPGM